MYTYIYTYNTYIYIYGQRCTYIYIYIYICRYLIGGFDESPLEQVCTPSFVLISFKYMHACIRPTERSAACSERSDEGRDCKLHITHTKNCTQHRLNAAHKTD